MDNTELHPGEDLPRRLLDEIETARYLSFSRQFLRKSRMEGKRKNHADGPPYFKIGRSIRYSIEELDKWIAEHRREIP